MTTIISISIQIPTTVIGLQIETVQNLRPVIPGLIYRSATLDNLSKEDAISILNGSVFSSNDNDNNDGEENSGRINNQQKQQQQKKLAAVIDLRNSDEIKKGMNKRTDGSNFFYSSLSSSSSSSGSPTSRLIHVPILNDVDAFWDEAIDRMDTKERIFATLQTSYKRGALDIAAARNLERGKHTMLYTIMLQTAKRPIVSALEACIKELQRGGPIIFHCQKGKDRTGILSMLIQSCIGDDEDEICKSYSLSGKLLHNEDNDDDSSSTTSSNSGMIDWSHFRGSPSIAMVETIQWLKEKYGSIDEYLDAASFNNERRETLRQVVKSSLL